MKFRVRFLIGLLAAHVLLADFDPAKWRFRRSIVIGAPRPMVSVRADAVLFGASAVRLADVRIARESVETPYVIETLRGAFEEREVEANIINQAVVAGPALQFTLDHGDLGRHNRVRLSTSARNFRQRVRIETSADGSHWAVARGDGSIFDISEVDRPASSLIVDYPVSTERFLRVTVFGWSDPKMVTGAWLTFHNERNATRQQVAVFDKPGSIVDLRIAGLPHDVLTFEMGPGLFSRSVEVEGSSDGKAWRFLGQGTIWRAAKAESLALQFPEDWDRFLRVRIMNRDDHALVVQKVTVEVIARQIRFPASQGGPYWIYYGNAAAQSPSYDLAKVAPQAADEFTATLGAQEANPAYRAPVPPPKPFSERHPGLLYAVLSVAILVMGYFAVRLFFKVSASSEMLK